MPKLSVVMTTYNRTEYLGEAIDALLAQSFRDFELIVIDNAANEATAAIVGSRSDPRARYVANERNLGASASAVRGFGLAVGEYILVTHDDDRMLPAFVEREVRLLDAFPEVALVTTNVAHIDVHGQRTLARRIPVTGDIVFKTGEYVEAHVNELVWLPTPTFMMRRSCAPIYPMFAEEPERLFNDVLFVCRVNARHPVALVADPLYEYRQHPAQDSRSRESQVAGRRVLWEQLRSLCEHAPDLRALLPELQTQVALLDIECAVEGVFQGAVDEATLPERVTRVVETLETSARTSHLVAKLQVLRTALVDDRTSSGPSGPSSLHRTLVLDHERAFTDELWRNWARANATEANPIARALESAGIRSIAIFGTRAIAYAFGRVARRGGANVRAFIDSQTDRHGNTVCGAVVASATWLSENADTIDAVLVTSEGANVAELRDGLGALLRDTQVRVLTWRDVASLAGWLPDS